jgi:hypothetical protein
MHQATEQLYRPLIMRGVDIFLNFVQVNMGHSCILAVEDLGQLFKSRSTGFDVEEVNK